MPSGPVHFEAWKSGIRRVVVSHTWAQVATTVFCFIHPSWVSDYWAEVLLWVSAGFNLISVGSYLLGMYIDPDLDQPGISQAEGRMRRHFKYVGYVFVAWWSVYANFMGLVADIFKTKGRSFGWAHRSDITHKVFPGTMIRVVWFNAPIYVLLIGYKSMFGLPGFVNWLTIVVYLLSNFYGLSVSDSLHIAMDNTYGD